jgi:DMSO/TMAO reductase YedYZ molybdopterin-dependent catalytic subunit
MTRHRLPPGQGLIRDPLNWPVVGERAPRDSPWPWEIAVGGLVANTRIWRLDHLAGWPRETRTLDIHCVTRWSKLDRRFSGVPLTALLDLSRPSPAARFLRFVARSDRDHDTTLPLSAAADCLIAFEAEGAPLPPEHGGPARVVTAGRYFYKSLKWLERIELIAENRLGYWEAGPGYHDEADPWRELRYVTGNIPPDLRARMIERRSLGRRDLLGVDFSGEALAGLDAAGATLRAVSFRDADLRGADFAGANLSNADLSGADLRDASFLGADVEGAAFDGADLRGADFTGASLFGASFSGRGGARVAGARIAPAQVAALADAEAAYLSAALDAAGSADGGGA